MLNHAYPGEDCLSVCLCSGDLNEMKTFFLRDFQADTIESLDLKYPDRLQLKPVKKSKDLQTDGTNADENCDHLQAGAEKDVLFDTRLKGLPGELSLDMDTTDKYFGDKSRAMLFERYQWLGHQRQITSTNTENDLEVLYFDAAEVDLNKRIPFGPMRKDNGPITTVAHLNAKRDMDNQSVQSSHATDTEASSVSKFRSRFKAFIVSDNDHRKATDQYDDLRLRESVLRSGVKGSSFDDDLRHHAEDVLLMDPTLKGLSRNSIGSADDVSEMSEASQSKRWVSKVPFRTGLQQPTKKELSPRSVDTMLIIKKEDCLKELPLVLENQYTVISGGAQVPSIREDNKHVAIASVETAPSTALDVPPAVTPAVVAVRRVTISDDSRPATAQPCASKHSTAHLPAAIISSGVIVRNKNSPHVNTATAAANRLSGMMSKRMTSQQQQGHTVRLRQASVRFPSPRRPKSAPLTALHERELVVQKPIDPIDPADKRLQRDEFSRIMLNQLLDKFSKIKLKQEEVAQVEPKALAVEKVRNTTVSVASLSVDGLDLELQLLLNNRHNGGVETATGTGVPITSPRTKYLAGCMKNNLNPRASLVLRKHMSKRLELQHHGFGDEMGKLLAECLVNLPFIESINIADNMLTDVGMGPIILAAVNISSLLELNLSQNEIGPVSAKALFDYLINASCTLERLILNSADVDDYECERFVEAIKDNKSLLELELSHNKIGSAENLKTVMPDLVTGGEALADLLRSEHCHLQSLKLDWNLIRMEGAIDLANSIASNKTLTFLDLSYNSLSTQGGIAIGVSILENRTLHTLILACNQLDAIACITISAGVMENRGLRRVVLDGNPIGEQGMRALMMIPGVAGNRVKVTAENCNISIRDPKCWFDFDKMIGDYELDMTLGFDRAIAMLLLHMIAGHHSLVFTKFTHEQVIRRKQVRSREMRLVQIMSVERSLYFDEKQRKIVEGLQRLKDTAMDIDLAVKLFEEVDADGSGDLDINELTVLFFKMGLDLIPRRVQELMVQFDVDQGGSIEFNDYLLMLNAISKDADDRIKEIIECPIMALKSNNTHQKEQQYLPPRQGKLKISVINSFAKKKRYRVVSSADKDYIQEMMKDVQGATAVKMINNSLTGAKLRIDEAMSIADRLLAENGDKVMAIRKLILQMNDIEDTRHLIMSLLGGSRTDLLRLKKEFGVALRPILGNPNGYYILNMTKPIDRICIERLLEISMTNASRRAEASKIAPGRVGDLSQHGNWSSFRNERLNGAPYVMSPAFTVPSMPTSGVLEFDFSGGVRPDMDSVAVSDLRVVKILMNHGILEPKLVPYALHKLHQYKKGLEPTVRCDGTTFYEVPIARSRQIGLAVEDFYQHLPARSKQHIDSEAKEASTELDFLGRLVVFFERDPYPIPLRLSDFPIDGEALGPIPFEIGALGGAAPMKGRKGQVQLSAKSSTPKEEEEESKSSSDSDSDSITIGSQAHPQELTARRRAPGGEANTSLGKMIDQKRSIVHRRRQKENLAFLKNQFDMVQGDEFLDKLRAFFDSPVVQPGAKAHRIIDLLQEIFSRSWLWARQLSLIVECFALHGYFKKTKFHGTYRVDLVVALFARLIDVHNFEVVLMVLSPYEIACLNCRLGWLNLYNPCKPEGSWELDMSHREERVICKTLCCLAASEPGDNWVFQCFRWMRSMPSMPGWELTQPWLTEEGMPVRGLVSITYYSGEGKNRHGCRPFVNYRKSFLNLVLINETDIVGYPDDPSVVLPGDKTFSKNKEQWATYLCPQVADSKRKKK